MTDIYKLEGTQLHNIFEDGKRYLENMAKNDYYEWSYKEPTVKYEPKDILPKTFNVSGKPCYLEVISNSYSLKLVTDSGYFEKVANQFGHFDNNENLGRLDGPALYSIDNFGHVKKYNWVVNNKTVDHIVKNFEEDLQKPVYKFSESEMEIMKFEMMIATKS